MAQGFTENVTIDEGVNANGIRTQLHFEGDDIIVQKTKDYEPLLKYAKAAREATAGMNWGDGRLLGTIELDDYYTLIAPIKDKKERDKAVLRYFKDKRDLLMFDGAKL